MSTRATIHFKSKGDSKPEAIIYRHSDGYPDGPGLGQDLQRFVADLKANVKDNRFGDPSYLAAKWVVWDAHRQREEHKEWDKVSKSKFNDGPDHVCNFLSIGILSEDAGDIEYRYTVVTCDSESRGKEPMITCEKIVDIEKLTGKTVKIPKLKIEDKA